MHTGKGVQKSNGKRIGRILAQDETDEAILIINKIVQAITTTRAGKATRNGEREREREIHFKVKRRKNTNHANFVSAPSHSMRSSMCITGTAVVLWSIIIMYSSNLISSFRCVKCKKDPPELLLLLW